MNFKNLEEKMKSVSKTFHKIFTISLLFILCIISVKADDLTAEDIVSKHLDAIGTKEKRAAIKNRMAIGISEFESKLPSRKTGGKMIIVSQGSNLFFVSSFNTENYPFEKIGYFNEKVNIPIIIQGTRSPLGTFISDHSKLLSEGLFAGTIASTWNFLNLQLKRGKLDAAGTKKIDGRKTYVVNYYESGSSPSFTIKLFFDAETFQHVRTEYRDVIESKAVQFGTLGKDTGSETTLTESFGDFKNESGITLPHLYKISFGTVSNVGTVEFNWNFKISEYRLNQNLAEDFFNF